jgi:Protein of unknown function (DUF3109).
MKASYIIQIEDKLISTEIITEYFCCDYEKCGGCCCVIGDSGAPLDKEEESILRAEYDNFKDLMTEKGRISVSTQGLAVIDRDGDLVTPLINNRECAYSLFDNSGNCFCAIEKSFSLGKSKYIKPISCRLYPIRVTKLSNGMIALNLHHWSLCECAFEKGKKEKVPVYKFLREPLIDAFGEDFYSALETSANNFLASK